ncbi:pantetheine-phosphate adenylyltransferase family protein, partial [Lentithecium fluviatile CBS 122367]
LRLQSLVRHIAAMPPSHKAPRALLLLPPVPAPSSYAALKAAYQSPLFTVLTALASAPRRAQDRALLEIALPCPHLYGRLHAPRGPLYDPTQSLVADLYKLICVIAANNAIDTEDADGVDARVVLVAYPRDGKLVQPSQDTFPEHELQGPAVDLYTLAKSQRPWDTIYSVECEQGESLLKNFLSYAGTGRAVKRVRGGIVTVKTPGPSAAPSKSTISPTNHLSVAVGGTFDHLHTGHKLLLTMFAFILGRRSTGNEQGPSTLTVGITGDALLVNKKYAEHLQSWGDRQRAVHDFLASVIYFGPSDNEAYEELNEPGPNGHAVHVTYPSKLVTKYVEISDPFGPTITDESITALVISLETRSGGTAVNNKRAEKGFAPLELFEVAVLDASEEESVDETFQSKLSSTEIRRMRCERT